MPESPQLGTIHYFGDYQVLGELARGGMGIVYLARQANLNREVALKLIRAGTLASREELALFRAEAEAAASLSHPHIVRVFESGEHEGQPFVAMDFIEGTSLARQLADGAWSLSPATAAARQQAIARLVATLADAIHYAHQHGIIHRDLKPANILVNEAGQPFVTDFGLAKRSNMDGGLTRSGQIMGTPGYLAPEQAAGNSKDVTAAADVYGLGAILFALLTGEPPFRGANELETLDQVRHQEPANPQARNAAVDRDLATICLKCLEKDPGRRYASARHLQEDLKRWLQNEPIHARAVSPFERARKWTRRRPLIAGLLAALAATAVAGIIGVTWQWRRARAGWDQALASNCRLALQRVEDHFVVGDSPGALALLARTLRDNPENRAAEERLAHALQYRRWLIPIAERLIEAEAVSLGFKVDCQTAARRIRRGRFEASAEDGERIRLWPAGETAAATEFRPPKPGVIRAITLSSDAKWLAAAVDGLGVCVWDARAAAYRGTLEHRTTVEAIDCCLFESNLVTATTDGTVRRWNLETLSLEAEAEAEVPGAVRAVQIAPLSALVAIGTVDGVVQLRRPETLTPCSEPRHLASGIDQLRFRVMMNSRSRDERLLARTANGDVVSFAWSQPVQPGRTTMPWPTPSLDPIVSVLGRPASNFHAGAEILRTNLSPDGRCLATGAMDGTARLWDATTASPRTEPLRHSGAVNSVMFSADSRRLLTAGADRRWRVWDVETGSPLMDWQTTDAPLIGVTFANDNRVVTSTGESWPLHASTGHAPEGLPALAEAIAGVRMNAEGVSLPLSHAEAAVVCGRSLGPQPSATPTIWLPRGDHAR